MSGRAGEARGGIRERRSQLDSSPILSRLRHSLPKQKHSRAKATQAINLVASWVIKIRFFFIHVFLEKKLLLPYYRNITKHVNNAKKIYAS